MTQRRTPWLPLLALVALAAFAALIWRGPMQMLTGMDLFLHGGASFVLVFGGNYLVWAVFKEDAEWQVFALALVVGILLEVAQFYLRTDFEAGDIVIDATGCLAGWATWRMVHPMLERSRG
jgi:hypothetical protein